MFPLTDVFAGLSPKPIPLSAVSPNALNLAPPGHLIHITGNPVPIYRRNPGADIAHKVPPWVLRQPLPNLLCAAHAALRLFSGVIPATVTATPSAAHACDLTP